MAQDPGKDRAAIKSDIALSRERMGTELNALRYELDLPRKVKGLISPSPGHLDRYVRCRRHTNCSGARSDEEGLRPADEQKKR